MVSRQRRPALALALLLVLPLVAGTGAAAPGTPLAQETPTPPAVDNTVTRIELAADGSARWTVTIRTRLDTQADVEAYESFQARFRENTSRFLGPFETRIANVVESAADATGRPMTATAFTAETRIQEVPRRWGIVEYGFTWDAFAAVEGDAVVMGDAFVGGFFLAANDTLVVAPPADYTITSVEPAPSQRGERAVGWTGRQDFADGRPLVRAVPVDAVGDGPGDDGSTRPVISPMYLGVAAVGLALLVGLAAIVYRRRSGSGATPEPARATAQTDEERVLELLEARGGRVPQAAFVEAFDWSTSKTSRLLTRMAEEGTVEKLQLGRENLIQLPDEE